MKQIVWTGESRVLPGYGLAVTGKHVLLPDEQAASYVAQGMAEVEISPTKSNSSKKSAQED